MVAGLRIAHGQTVVWPVEGDQSQEQEAAQILLPKTMGKIVMAVLRKQYSAIEETVQVKILLFV